MGSILGKRGVFHKVLVGWGPAHDEKWTQQDLKFWKNKGSKRSKNHKKGGQQDRKSRKNLYKMLENGQMTDFAEKLDQI